MNDMPEEIFASSTLPSKSTGTWGRNELELEGDESYTKTVLTDRRDAVDELIEKIRELPVEEWITEGPNGQAELVGYLMQAQGEWDAVLKAIQKIQEARNG